MKEWETAALEILTSSLKPIPVAKNELEWKTSISDKTEKVAQHICALANLDRGGFLVFGITNDGPP